MGSMRLPWLRVRHSETGAKRAPRRYGLTMFRNPPLGSRLGEARDRCDGHARYRHLDGKIITAYPGDEPVGGAEVGVWSGHALEMVSTIRNCAALFAAPPNAQ